MFDPLSENRHMKTPPSGDCRDTFMLTTAQILLNMLSAS
jgi:hypothetical protein